MSNRPTMEGAIPSFTDILGEVAERLAAIPPRPIFASGAFFPSDAAWVFQRDGQDYVLAGPKFWESVPASDSGALGLNLFAGIPVIDIDDPRNAEMRDKVMTALGEHYVACHEELFGWRKDRPPSVEVEALKLDLRAAECLHDSQYKAGVKHGWNLCASGDEAGYQAATSGTEHIAELKRIRAERESLHREEGSR